MPYCNFYTKCTTKFGRRVLEVVFGAYHTLLYDGGRLYFLYISLYWYILFDIICKMYYVPCVETRLGKNAMEMDHRCRWVSGWVGR